MFAELFPPSSSFQLMQILTLYTLPIFSLLLIIGLFHSYQSSALDLVNGKTTFELSASRSKGNFLQNAYELISTRLAKVPGKPFRIIADIGEVTILPPDYAYEIRNDERFSFTKAAYRWFYAHLPGLEGFEAGTNETHLMKLVARHQLTLQLTKVTNAVSEECVAALQEIYTDNKEWHSLPVRHVNLQLIARVSSRIFLGLELCRNPAWLEITSTYSVVAFRAVEELRKWPAFLRPVVLYFLPNCTRARDLVKRTRALITPVLEQRRKATIEAAEKGEKLEINDAISWLEDLAQGKGIQYDPACAQLSLSTAALHSTTDFFTQVVLDIAADPSLIDALRVEIQEVLGKGTWTKHSLYNLKLMDSVLKESQRLKPIAIASMRRFTEKNITLADGVTIPKHSLTLVFAQRHWDLNVYPDPHTFDPYRFLHLRNQSDKKNTSQLVSATVDHMGFGYGLHACPGRFFASEEIKIMLAHMLMRYDVRLIEGCDVSPKRFGFSFLASPTARVEVRRRQNSKVLGF